VKAQALKGQCCILGEFQHCGQLYKLGGDDFTCPKCGGSKIRLVSGDEFYLDAIEIETNQVQA
jgi:Zn finger protein HypA/HybF involved in hydrogenase expression